MVHEPEVGVPVGGHRHTLVVALLGVIQFIVAISNKYVDASFGAFMLLLFSSRSALQAALLLMG